MFKTFFSHQPTSTPHPKSNKDNSESTKGRSWYFTTPNPSNGQNYMTTNVPIARKESHQRLSIVVGRQGNVEIVTHGHSGSQGHTTTAKHHNINSGSHPHSNNPNQPNMVLMSSANQSSHTKRHEKHPSASPPLALQRVVSNDDRSRAINKRHSIIGVQRDQGPRSDVATTGGSVASRPISSNHRPQSSHQHQSNSHSHHGSKDRDDSKQYPKSPYPSKSALPTTTSRHDSSPDNRHHRHSNSHQSSQHQTSSHQAQAQAHNGHASHHGHHRTSSDPYYHNSSGKENVPLRNSQVIRHSPSNLADVLNSHSQAFLQVPLHSQPQPQPQPHHHSRSRSNSRSRSPSRPHSAEKHVRYLDPTHPQIIPDRAPITAQSYPTSVPIAAAPIGYTRTRHNSMPVQPPLTGTYFGDPYSDHRHSHSSHSVQNGHSVHQTRFSKPRGWFNRRGDQYIAKGVVKKQPPELQWHPVFASYPEVGRGWMDEEKKFLPPSGGILKN